MWRYLKEKNVQCVSSTAVKGPLYRYGSEEPMELLGKFQCIAKTNGIELAIEVIVYKGNAPAILCRKTSIDFGILKMGPDINAISNSQIENIFSQCCDGIGKLKNFCSIYVHY